MPVSIYRTTSAKELRSKLAEWTSLSDKTSPAAPFCRPETWVPYLESLLAHRPDHSRKKQPGHFVEAIIVEWRDEGELRGVLPLYRSSRVLKTLSENHIDYQDIIAPSHRDAKKVLEGAIRFAKEEKHLLILGQVAAGSRLDQAISDCKDSVSAFFFRRYYGYCTVFECDLESPKLDDFLKVLPRQTRRSFQRSVRHMGKAPGEFHFEISQETALTDDDLRPIAEIHRRNQKGRKGGSVFDIPQFPEFLKRQSKTQKEFVLARLFYDGELIAFILGYFSGNTYQYYVTGYDHNYASMGPGIALLINTCAHYIENRQLRAFSLDLLTGNEAYKKQWETRSYRVDRVIVVPKVLRMIPVRIGYSVSYGLKSLKNRILKIGPFRSLRDEED